MSTRQDVSDGAKILAGIVALVILVVIISVSVWAFKASTQEVRGQVNQGERTKANADYRIASYDRFFNLCAAVQAKEEAIKAVEQQDATTPQQQTQKSANLTALRASRAALINQYNADAAKEGTRGQFQASTLPHTLNLNQESTTCVV